MQLLLEPNPETCPFVLGGGIGRCVTTCVTDDDCATDWQCSSTGDVCSILQWYIYYIYTHLQYIYIHIYVHIYFCNWSHIYSTLQEISSQIRERAYWNARIICINLWTFCRKADAYNLRNMRKSKFAIECFYAMFAHITCVSGILMGGSVYDGVPLVKNWMRSGIVMGASGAV